jgi:hypothetical protein
LGNNRRPISEPSDRFFGLPIRPPFYFFFRGAILSFLLKIHSDVLSLFFISEVSLDLHLLTDEVFIPEQLKYSLSCPIWELVCYPKEHTKDAKLPILR